MGRLLLLFIAVPAVELVLLVEIGKRIGTPSTLGLIVLTGALGAALARGQGLRVIGEIQTELGQGRVPGHTWIEGAMILVAAALLVTPGILTDAFGFMCLIPPVRHWISLRILARLRTGVVSGSFRVYRQESPGEREMKDITPKRPPSDPS